MGATSPPLLLSGQRQKTSRSGLLRGAAIGQKEPVECVCEIRADSLIFFSVSESKKREDSGFEAMPKHSVIRT